jgi:hypothetical protein
VITFLGSGYLLSVPEVRLHVKLAINRISRNQVFKDVTVSGSNIINSVNAERGGSVTILQESHTQKKPYLRADPKLYYTSVSGAQSGQRTIDFLQFSVEVTNLGDGVATDIRGQATLVGPEPWQLPKDGRFEIHPLAPRESVNQIIVYDSPVKLSRQKSYIVTLTFKDQDGRDMTPARIEGQVSDLKIGNFGQMLR